MRETDFKQNTFLVSIALSFPLFSVDDSYGQCSRGEKCRPTVQCSSQFPKTKDLTSRTCQLDDLSPGTCCKDITKSWGPMSDKTVQSGGLAANTRSFSIPFNAK